MFKRMALITGALAFSIFLSATTCSAASVMKVGVLDLQKALNATSEGLEAKERLRVKHEEKQSEVDDRKAELDSLEEKIQSPVLSEEAKAQLEKDYRKKRADLIEFVTSAKEEEDRENQKLSARILDGLVNIAQEIAKKENYNLILEKSGSGVVYFDQEMDLTDRVVKIYNERFQGEKSR